MLKNFLYFMNHFPIKWWILIYVLILASHITSLLIGYDLSTLGFLLSVVTYYILLTKTRLWTTIAFMNGLLMFIIFLFLSVVLVATDYIGFYEMCILIGFYELTLMIMFFKIPIIKKRNIDYKKINFIRNLLAFILLAAALYYIHLGFYGYYKEREGENISGFAYPLYLIAILIVIVSIISANIFNGNKKNMDSDKNIILTESDQLDIETIKNFFTNSTLYLKHSFSIDDLSQHTNIERKRLSFLMNSGMNMNYYKLIAYYRILHAKKLLETEPDYTMDYIASQCGFTSIPVFIKYFKIYVGTTPKKYQDQCIKQN